ncbi:hypothetical protein G5714_015061 [Onychostoma macrolepis]|uniref:Alpha-2-macroglobulin n=1 Tax=Onychostoma macrolepis TaxID=369639 RepID=A0A7J6CAJ5_9TELE|nr:hypothetical protein G5714_015061 [Onychostoma macrolepis]
MDLNVSCCWKGLLLFFFLLVCVNGQTSGPYFMVTFPAVIESGSEAKLCASLLKPNESLVMNIYLVNGKQSTLLLQEKAEEEFHRCFNFKAPLVEAESVQKMKVELQGESFKMTEERKVMFRSYHPLTFIQTDKPIYIPGQTDKKTGCAIHTIDVSVFLNSTLKFSLQNSLRVEAMVTEEETEITMTKSETISLTYEIGNVTLKDLPKTYEHGSVIEGKIKLSNFKEAPIPNKEVYLFEGETWSSKLLLNLTTDSDGLASFALNTSSLPEKDINLMASVYPGLHYQSHKTPYISMDRKTVQLYQPATPYTPTLSELIIENIEQPLTCDAEFTVTIKYYFVGETVEDFKTDIVYMVLSRGVIVHHGYEKVEVKSSNGAASGTVSFKLSVGADLAPAVQILAYCVLPSENVAAGNTKFDVEKCFSNKISLQFSPAKAVPGEKNTLQISAQPGSLCGLGAVDQSVLILKSGKRLDTDKIFDLLPVRSVSGYPYDVEDQQECLHVRARRALSTDNAYESLKRVGLKMATNLAVRVPQCLSYRGLTYHRYSNVMYRQHAPVPVLRMSSLAHADFDTSSRDSPAVSIRTVFPETWIWELAEVGDSGSAQVPVTVPDTITSWDTEAFCLSSKGLGLAPPAQLTVFQPFFLELSLPYSIIRGEIFELKATVFNYLSKCIMVKVTPAPSSDYTLKASSDDQYSSCLCANGRKTFKWILTPSVLGVLNITVSAEAESSQTVCDNEIVSVPERGRIDTVTRSLLVQAEGTEKTETYSWLLCPKGDSLSEEVDLTLPKDVIEGSARSSVSVIGDILGRALSNLHGLLRMPYGCGEQNMAVLSPNIYILQYLENTEQLTSAIRERATGFLKSGYQRQLNYKHFDGAYSTFGYGDGNTWLTAFVLRSFGKAQKYIFIDPHIIQSAKEWLISRRDSDGCFIQQGRLFNNRMKGGVNDNVTMTAYITASLLELETPVTDPVITKGLSCLRSVIEDVKNTYTTALLAYTFSLAGDTDTRQQLFKKLEDVAISEGSRLHWSQSASADDSDSLAVEISSYVLLAALTADSLTTADLGFANRIVSWLVKQQNAYGGFSSTQDTVVALQALSLYATKVFSSDGSSTVTVQSAGDTHHFDVNQDNKLLYQEKQLQNVPAKYSIEVKGSTCVSVQVAQFYNIPTPTEAKTLSIDAKIEGDCKTLGQNFILNFTVKYDGLQESTNMVIVDIKLLSGFTADTATLGTSSGTYASLVERVDVKDDHVIVYLKEIPKNTPMNYQILMKQVLPVKNLRPAVVKVYDYYQTMIESGSEAKLCASLLKPNESLVMNIYLVNGKQSTLLLQEKAEEEFHRCFNFKAPLVEAESVQKMKVELQGESFKMTEERKVMFRSYHPLTFIQTDKPIYIPGQTVNFRVVTMDTNFAPLDQQYGSVVLEDSRGNRIGQWTNVSSTRWILQRSYELNPEAGQGVYRLKTYIGDRMISHDFEVKKYVLPKYEVTVKRPNKVSVDEEELIIEVCGKYTYGQPVPGKSWVKVCRNIILHLYTPDRNPVCLEETTEVKKTGCAIHTIDVSVFLNSTVKSSLQNSLLVEAMFTEEGTEIAMTKSETISLTYEIGKVTLDDLPKTYEHGSVIEGKIKLSNYKEAPIQNKEVNLFEGETWSSKLLLNLTTDSDGLASFALNTSSLPEKDINLMASVYPGLHYQSHKTPYISMDRKTVQLYQPATPYTPTLSELIIENIEQPLKCDAELTVTIKYYFIGETAEDFKTDIVYMVLSRGVIVHHGYEKVEVKSSNGAASGTVSFKLSVGADLAPAVQILAYCVLPSENVAAGSTKFDVEKCFSNKISLQFSPAKAVPGEKNTLQISAQPGSLCGLSAVDQSVLILESGKRLDTDKIFNLLPVQSVSRYPYTVEDQQECLHVRARRALLTDNAYESLKRVGLKMATNLAVRVPQCLSYRGLTYHRYSVQYFSGTATGLSRGVGAAADFIRDSPAVTIRTVFPETWIWELAEVGDSGSAQVPVTVPDTITSWETEAFCLSSKGLGLAPPAQLTVFQPFFLELSLPYSIIRGEIFELKATVFNYLSKCIMVKVTPAPSSDYTLKASSDDQYSSCLCANGRKTFKWILTPSVLGVLNITVSAEAEASQTVCDNEIVSVPERGRIDTVTRSLLVQAEGTEKTETYSWLLCPKGDSLSEEVDLTLPKDVIEGSARSSVSVIGDILGRALSNLHGLLRMPYGCGEQNMAVLSPNIYILQYLENTEQLTSAIRERATGFLKSGYQRQLNYRHNSGAYSTFGFGHENTWLTAFVLRSFGKAQKYIFIDPHIIQSAKEWLISRRDSDGCFIQQGRLFNNRMKGGVNDNVTMTAYIIASLLELETPVTDPVVTKGLSCLRSVIEDVKNTYTTALLAYTFSLAGDTDTRQKLFKKLEDVAISDGSRLHWSQSASADDSDSLAVEISSYVLLAALTAESLTTADLGFANRIVSWLVKQQNAYGGFSSTQDTVVALQALSLYATKVFSSDGSSTVTVQSAGDTHHFDVNQDNKLLYQEKQLQNVPAKYSIEVKGSTCVSVQMSLFYNIPTPKESKALQIFARTGGVCRSETGQILDVELDIMYTGTEDSSNMIIVDMKLLSGFKLQPSSLDALKKAVHRVESKDDHVIMYLQEVQKYKLLRQALYIKKIFSVKNLKPAVVKVYDYYQTSERSEAEYSNHCLRSDAAE